MCGNNKFQKILKKLKLKMAINDSSSFLLQVRDPEDEVCEWLVNNIENIPLNVLSVEKLRSYMKINERETIVAAENNQFCSSDLSTEVDLKTAEKAKIRKKVNPFEAIGNCGFRSRTTVKAANLDWMVEFTEPLDQQGNPLIDNNNEGLCYSDLFGEQDGFVEYIEWRKRSQNQRTTKIDLSYMCPHRKTGRSFKITDPLIMNRFITNVRNSDVGARLHLLAVDFYSRGIFFLSPNASEISNEVYFKHSTLSYCVLALSLLRPNGTFIMKIYRTQKLFTVGLMYLMYRCFEKISIVKPTSSRPDHSERYVICKWKKAGEQTDFVRQYLYDVYVKLNDLEGTNFDVMQLVPFEVLEADKTFFDYIYAKNDEILKNILQCVNCIKRILDSKVKLHDPRNTDFKERCIRLWDLTERVNAAPLENDRSRRSPIDNWRSRKSPIDNWRRKDN